MAKSVANKKHFIVLGLGAFGAAVARKLTENGCRVTGMDSDEERVSDLKDVLYEAVIGDATDPESLGQLSLEDADTVIISLGTGIEPSLLATLHARELGAKRIIVKGLTYEHSKILKHLGVDRVVFPKLEVAAELGDRLTWPNVLDFLPIDPEYSVVELAVPESISGETLRSADLRKRYGVWVIGVKDAMTGKLEILPDPDFRLTDDQMLLVLGKQDQLNALRELS